MSATKAWIEDIEETCWDEVAEMIRECEHVSEAMNRAHAIFAQAGLLGYLNVQQVDEGVSEMWNEFWSAYA